jgi:hypothetical protein
LIGIFCAASAIGLSLSLNTVLPVKGSLGAAAHRRNRASHHLILIPPHNTSRASAGSAFLLPCSVSRKGGVGDDFSLIRQVKFYTISAPFRKPEKGEIPRKISHFCGF